MSSAETPKQRDSETEGEFLDRLRKRVDGWKRKIEEGLRRAEERGKRKALRGLVAKLGPYLDRVEPQFDRHIKEHKRLQGVEAALLAAGRKGLEDPVRLADDTVAGVLGKRAWSIKRTLVRAGYRVVRIGPYLYGERADIAAIFQKCRKHL